MTIPFVFGLGSSHGDDQAGWLMIDRLLELGYPKNRTRKAAHPADLLNEMHAELRMTVCDACQEQPPAEMIRHWSWPTDELPTWPSSGSHDLSLPQILELTQTLARCPAHIDIWGISGRHWLPNTEPSPVVRAAAYEVAARLWSHCHA